MPKAHLTKRTVDAAAPPSAGSHTLWDLALPGFGLRIRSTGRKVYVAQYRTKPAGRTRLVTLGDHGRLTPTEARDLARQVLLRVSRGEDPAADRDRTRAAGTVADLAARYLSDHAEPKKRPSSVREDRRLLDKRILPKLGSRNVSEVDRADIASLHRSLRETPVEANRTLALASVLFRLAEKWGLRADGSNPCRHVAKYPERPRERFLARDELVRLGVALSEAESEGSEPPAALAAIRLLLVTGMRRSEVLSLRWDAVDLSRGQIRLREAKAGARTVQLPTAALELLSRIERLPEAPFVFAGKNPGSHFVGIQKVWERIRERAKLADVRLHDLRHNFASVGAAAGATSGQVVYEGDGLARGRPQAAGKS